MPGTIEGAGQNTPPRGCDSKSRMMNTELPYITMVSPGSRTPALTASEAASAVPAMTGVPSASPVSAAAEALTPPAISVVQIGSAS